MDVQFRLGHGLHSVLRQITHRMLPSNSCSIWLLQNPSQAACSHACALGNLGMRLFIHALAGCAAFGRRLRLQTLVWNLQSAIEALAISASLHPIARGVEGVQLGDIED